jgi:AcrR family transcriptional regulator
VQAAARLLAEGGREAVSTRAVAAAAGVQAPTIYRQFGDMRGLLDEVASYGFSTYLRDKTRRERAEDPVEDLRQGWDLHVEFGVANPALYKLMYGDPVPGASPPRPGKPPRSCAGWCGASPRPGVCASGWSARRA